MISPLFNPFEPKGCIPSTGVDRRTGDSGGRPLARRSAFVSKDLAMPVDATIMEANKVLNLMTVTVGSQVYEVRS